MDLFKKLPIFLYEKILNFIYPPICLICGKHTEEVLCKKCEKELETLACYNIDVYKNKYFTKHAYIFNYKWKIRKLIIDYKFNDKAYLYEVFVKFMLKNEKICRFFKTYDIIMPVPIHKKRKMQRGYDQSELIAKKIAKKYDNLQLQLKNLEKYKNTTEQSKLTKKERIENAKNVYKVNDIQKIYNKNIILIDDIYTTGSTANSVARVLKQNGAKNIIIITIAKD